MYTKFGLSSFTQSEVTMCCFAVSAKILRISRQILSIYTTFLANYINTKFQISNSTESRVTIGLQVNFELICQFY